MPRSIAGNKLSVLTACSAALLVPILGLAQDSPDPGEKAIMARQGFMKVVVWEAGPLFGMAKGDVAYDAAMAQAHAENLNAIIQYSFPRLFVDGTANSERPGKTRALPKIWEDMAGFDEDFQALRDRVAVVVAEAVKGQPELASAVQEMGKACGNCHDSYREEDS